MIRFFHTADIHIGVENYGKIDSKTGLHTRLLDFSRSLDQIIDRAIKEDIDFFLFCGDAYKTAFPTPTQQKILMQSFFKLYKANIPIISVVGNHDNPLSFGKVNSLEVLDYLPLDGFEIISKPKILKVNTKNGPVQIVGIPWPSRNNIVTTEEYHLKNYEEISLSLSNIVSQIIKNFALQLDPEMPSVLAAHLTVSTGLFSGSEKMGICGADPIFLPSQLAVEPFDYIALGHLHKFQNLNPNGYPAVVYSGSIERVDFGERKENKGFCSVTIDNQIEEKNKRTKFDFIELGVRTMLQIEVELVKDKDQTEQVLEEISKYNICDSIIKIIYQIPENDQDQVDLNKIQESCKSAFLVVGIVPVKKVLSRVYRANLKVDMNLNTILDKYFESKNLDLEQKSKLIGKAEILYSEINQDT